MQFLQKMGELILTDMAFLLCCIPVVTAGAAATSLYYTVIKSIRRERGNFLQEYFRSMKRTLAKGCILTVMLIAWFFGLYYWGSRGGRHAASVCLGLGLVSLCAAVYLFPVLSRFEMKISGIIKLSFVMCIRFWPVTLFVAAGTAAVGWLLVYILPMPCFFFVPALWCFLTTFPMERALLAYMPEPEPGEDAWYYGKSGDFEKDQ